MRRGPALIVLAVLLAGLLAGCSGAAEAPAPVPSAGSGSPPSSMPRALPSTSASSGAAYSDWELGVHVLPRTPDGYGEIRRTPKPLRHRRFPTADLLAPPADGGFHATVGPVTEGVRERMGETWSPACPVALGDLAYVTVSFRGFDGRAHTGELVLAAEEADDVVSVFRALFAAGYPIEEMRLPTTADLEAPPTGDGNNTAALVCRAARGHTSWSAHAYGRAVDVNPFLNPYHAGDVVLPERASAYLDRTRTQPGIIHAGDLIVREFARIGWTWGGSWHSLKDDQHFSATGR